MKKVKSFIITSAVVSLIACGDDSQSSKSNAPEEPLREVPTIYDLGACTKDRNGDTVFVIDKAVEYLCIGNDWLDITTQSTDVPQPSESDGISSSDTQTPEHLSSINGDAENSSSSVADDPLNNNSSSSVKATYIEVAAQNKLTICDSSNIGLRALVLADSTYFTCKAKGWVKDSVYLGYEIVKTREDLGVCNTGNAKQRILVKKDSVFFNCDSEKWVPETADGYIVKNASILGAAQKGPFKFDSPLMLREVLLHNDALTYTGREYIDEISSNKGDFVIPKVNLVYPYAVLEVRGQWRNEISGEWSKDSMTLRALTDLTSRTEVNINLLTHLEYDRAVQLVSKGYSVFAAKKQAEYEIMTAFGFATTIEYSENLKTFVASTSEDHESNATLMAIALLFIGDRSEAEIVSAINDFKRDMASDGTWDDEQAKADMADWAESFDGGSIRANVKSWNILTIPDYENYLTIFWNNAYELGGCSSTRSGVIVQNKNAKSKNYNVHYICKATSWQKATDYEKDTYQWADGKDGEFKKGNVTETYYVFENGKWSVAKNESALGLCTEARSGEIGKVDTTYFVCKNKKWGKATVLEYDTYQFSAGEDGEVRAGKVNADKFYVYENGTWRASASEIENNLGACVTNREGEKNILNSKYYICENKSWKEITAVEYILGYCTTENSNFVNKLDNIYYICKNKNWTTATILEYDTYEFGAGEDGEVRAGKVNTDKFYVYENGAWRVSTGEIENNLGACVTSREGEKNILNSNYYICENTIWTKVSLLEYETFGWTASVDGEVRQGEFENYYVYDNGGWRAAKNSLEKKIGICTASREKVVTSSEDHYYICKSLTWYYSDKQAYETYIDTHEWDDGVEGEIRSGSVNTEKHYIYKDGLWQVASSVEMDLGLCTFVREGEIDKSQSAYYICKSKSWYYASILEYDTYGWDSGIDGEIKPGSVNTNRYYIYKDERWQAASSVEVNLGGCTDLREREVGFSGNSYYICVSKNWKTATVLEYDTYGKICSYDGAIVIGEVTDSSKYTCDLDVFREVDQLEKLLELGCTSYTEGVVLHKQFSPTTNWNASCLNHKWNIETEFTYGLLTDSRDNQVYKTVVIGSQTWMAENLNYSDSITYEGMKGRSWCNENNCSKYGRLYNWAAAMDSAGTFSTNGKGCGYSGNCSPTYPVRGLCPEGWHLPDTTEWRILFKAMDSMPHAMQAIGYEKWYDATDIYGFSALPVGYNDGGHQDNVGSVAYFWSANESKYPTCNAQYWNLGVHYADRSSYFYYSKQYGFSVRCVKD